MAIYSVVLLTAPPAGLGGDAGGAFIKVDGREAVLRAIELFLNRDNIKQIQLVVEQRSIEDVRKKFGANFAFSGVKLLGGGAKWIEQIQAAAPALGAECTHVLLHDAARAAVPYTDIEAVMAASETSEAVVLAAPVRAGLLEVDEGMNPVAAHLPSRFLQLQTPQIYAKKTFQKMAATGQEPHPSELTVVKGSPLNVRLGGGDAGFVKAMIAMLPKAKRQAASSPFDEAQW